MKAEPSQLMPQKFAASLDLSTDCWTTFKLKHSNLVDAKLLILNSSPRPGVGILHPVGQMQPA